MSERKIKLQLKDMAKKYPNGDGVEHINLDIYEGEIVSSAHLAAARPRSCAPSAASMT